MEEFDVDRRGISIIGPLELGPASESSMCDGGVNQPLREAVVSLTGEGIGDVGSA